MKKKYINIIIGLMAIGGGFAAANLRQWSINNIADSTTCTNILLSEEVANKKLRLEKRLITEEQIEEMNQQYAKDLELSDYEIGFISTVFGAMSSKVNTIIDFFFGGSSKSK